jgi:hypothetical protein
VGIYILPADLEPYVCAKNMDVDDVADDIAFYSEAEGSFFHFNKTGEICDDELVPEFFYFGQISKYPSLFARAYQSYDEAINELKEKYTKYLIKDFPFEDRFVEFCGTVCGRYKDICKHLFD